MQRCDAGPAGGDADCDTLRSGCGPVCAGGQHGVPGGRGDFSLSPASCRQCCKCAGVGLHYTGYVLCSAMSAFVYVCLSAIDRMPLISCCKCACICASVYKVHDASCVLL